MKRNITKKETHAITKKEWQDVFKDTITVRRQKDLFDKINERLNFISRFLDCGREFYTSSQNDIQCCDDSDIIDIEDCVLFIEDGEEIFGYENPPVFWLWDDSWIKQIENYRAKKKMKEADEKVSIDNIVHIFAQFIDR